MKRAHTRRRRPAEISARRLRSSTTRIAAASLKPAELLSLQAFDVAVRTGSFKATAHALNLSASAVSHRIRNLEGALGQPLFVRSHRAVHPTAAGKALAAATGRAFAELARTGVPVAGGRQRLKLKVFPLFASAWLIPRLAGFIAKHPDIDLAIETSMQMVDFDVEAFDAGIGVGDGKFAGLEAQHLAPLRATPIATPALARRLRLRSPKDLERAVLIHVTASPASWQQWLQRAGVPKLEPRRSSPSTRSSLRSRPPSKAPALHSAWTFSLPSANARAPSAARSRLRCRPAAISWSTHRARAATARCRSSSAGCWPSSRFSEPRN